jgi:hypothetical protein
MMAKNHGARLHASRLDAAFIEDLASKRNPQALSKRQTDSKGMYKARNEGMSGRRHVGMLPEGMLAMVQTEGRSVAPNLLGFPELAEMNKKRIETFADAQRELLNQVQESNRQWFDRMQSEAKVASDCANKVIAARSIPEAMTAYQEWASRQLEMTAEDAKHFFADGQKFIEASTRLMSGGLSTH